MKYRAWKNWNSCWKGGTDQDHKLCIAKHVSENGVISNTRGESADKTSGMVDIFTRFLYNTVIAQGRKTSSSSTGKHRIHSEVKVNGSFWYAM